MNQTLGLSKYHLTKIVFKTTVVTEYDWNVKIYGGKEKVKEPPGQDDLKAEIKGWIQNKKNTVNTKWEHTLHFIFILLFLQIQNFFFNSVSSTM